MVNFRKKAGGFAIYDLHLMRFHPNGLHQGPVSPDFFKAGVPDVEDEDVIVVDDATSIDDVFAFGLSHSRASIAMVVPREEPRRSAELFGEIMGEAAAIKGIAMPALPPALMSDDMQGECFRTQSSPRRATLCPLFPPVQHFFTAAGGDPSTLKAPAKAYSDFINVEGWADTQARGIPRLEPPLAALLCPGARWRPNENPRPPDRLQKQIVGLRTECSFVPRNLRRRSTTSPCSPLPWSPFWLAGRLMAQRKPQDGLQFPGSPAPSSSYAS
ncbi:unnamed protein product [Boreogadus saida]